MIVEEVAVLNSGRRLIRRHSDLGMKLIQTPTGIMFDDVVDVEGAPYVYVESNTPVEKHEEE